MKRTEREEAKEIRTKQNIENDAGLQKTQMNQSSYLGERERVS